MEFDWYIQRTYWREYYKWKEFWKQARISTIGSIQTAYTATQKTNLYLILRQLTENVAQDFEQKKIVNTSKYSKSEEN